MNAIATTTADPGKPAASATFRAQSFRQWSTHLGVALTIVLVSTSARGVNVIEVSGGLDIFPDEPGAPFNFVSGSDGTITLDLGVNRMAGFFNCQTFGCADDFESFRMIVPEGLQVVLTEFEVQNADGTSEMLDVYAEGAFTEPERLTDDWLSSASYRPLELRLFDNLTNDPEPATSATVFNPGTYDVVVFNWGWIGGGAWAVEFVTAPVPEPSIAALGGLMAAGLWGRRRRR